MQIIIFISENDVLHARIDIDRTSIKYNVPGTNHKSNKFRRELGEKMI